MKSLSSRYLGSFLSIWREKKIRKEKGSVDYPTTIASIYNATMNLLQQHLHSCLSITPEIKKRYSELKADDARSGSSKK